ncbi:MAG: tRNA (adenosine(37)-N6)-threonylcarbamoyltransferase complex ATPase subunit type 1 TsaE [Ectothiorhodospiraceae bacterium]|nr:tRNA (adenosine(37)-N6)-threonylcarbamoyltransferase complex ATPase subunit type 1 TsaE [Ectothiorhodospiraceae bacterium]
MCLQLSLPDAAATEGLGARLARCAPAQLVVFLYGDLGAGKTTLVRGLLRQLGHRAPVPSPTYTLLEPYDLGDRTVLHLDLYRLADPEELDYLGLRDYLVRPLIMLVEWPERGAGMLPASDLELWLEYANGQRLARLVGRSEAGERLVQRLGNR